MEFAIACVAAQGAARERSASEGGRDSGSHGWGSGGYGIDAVEALIVNKQRSRLSGGVSEARISLARRRLRVRRLVGHYDS